MIFQVLFKRLALKNKLKKCFSHLKISPIFGHHTIVLLLIVHLTLGFRRIREIDYYREDPMILRLMGLKRLPDASTISRCLASLDDKSVGNIRRLSRSFVINGLQRERFSRLTMDFDGSVLSTKGHAEGSAIGFNKKKKGARSYYPLFCTISQTGQFSRLDKLGLGLLELVVGLLELFRQPLGIEAAGIGHNLDVFIKAGPHDRIHLFQECVGVACFR